MPCARCGVSILSPLDLHSIHIAVCKPCGDLIDGVHQKLAFTKREQGEAMERMISAKEFRIIIPDESGGYIIQQWWKAVDPSSSGDGIECHSTEIKVTDEELLAFFIGDVLGYGLPNESGVEEIYELISRVFGRRKKGK